MDETGLLLQMNEKIGDIREDVSDLRSKVDTLLEHNCKQDEKYESLSNEVIGCRRDIDSINTRNKVYTGVAGGVIGFVLWGLSELFKWFGGK